MELSICGFADVPRDPRTKQLGTTAQAMRNLLEAIRLADEVGLDYFGVGEHTRMRCRRLRWRSSSPPPRG